MTVIFLVKLKKNHFLWRQKPLEFIARLLSLGNHDLSPLTKCPQTWKEKETLSGLL